MDEETNNQDEVATRMLWLQLTAGKCQCGGLDVAEWRQWIAYLRKKGATEMQIESFANRLCHCEAAESAMRKLQPVSSNGIPTQFGRGSIIR